MSKWTEHLKAYAAKHEISYKEAMKDPKSKEEYHAGKSTIKPEIVEEVVEEIKEEKKKRKRRKSKKKE